MSAAPNKSFIARLDGVTILLYILLVAIGLLAVFSVEHREGMPILNMKLNATKQLIFFGVSLFFRTDNSIYR